LFEVNEARRFRKQRLWLWLELYNVPLDHLAPSHQLAAA